MHYDWSEGIILANQRVSSIAVSQLSHPSRPISTVAENPTATVMAGAQTFAEQKVSSLYEFE